MVSSHRPLADPPWMKPAEGGSRYDGRSPDRGRRSLVLESPMVSWTRGASKTPTGAKGGNVLEHDC